MSGPPESGYIVGVNLRPDSRCSFPVTRVWCIALLAAAISGLTVLLVAAEQPAPAAPRVDFTRQIRPLLSDRCFRCHGPDASRRKAKLRLDQRERAFGRLPAG